MEATEQKKTKQRMEATKLSKAKETETRTTTASGGGQQQEEQQQQQQQTTTKKKGPGQQGTESASRR